MNKPSQEINRYITHPEQLSAPLMILGGAYSGKSELGNRALLSEMPAVVIGTSLETDTQTKLRINELKSNRPDNWTLVECPKELPTVVDQALQQSPQVLIDSINQHIATAIIERMESYSIDQVAAQIESEIKVLIEVIGSHSDKRVVIVSSEVGCSPPPDRNLAQVFRQLTSKTNTKLASMSKHMIFSFSGVALQIK